MKEVVRGIQQGRVSQVIVAKNCPAFIIEKVKHAKSDIAIETFAGDQNELGTRFGKPYFTAIVGLP